MYADESSREYQDPGPISRQPAGRTASRDDDVAQGNPQNCAVAETHIACGMLGYGSYHYRYASGREGGAPVVGLASQKQHISLYICVSDDNGHLPEQKKSRLGKVSVGKGCIRFKRLDDLNLPVAMELVRRAAKASKQLTDTD